MSFFSVEEQVARLRPYMAYWGHIHRWFLAGAALCVIAAAVLANPVPLMIAAFLGIVGFSSQRVGPNIMAAITAYDIDTPSLGEVSIAITCWDTDNHYNATVCEQGHPEWEYEFIPQGWKPDAGSYPAKIWRSGTEGRPILSVVEGGILIPRDDPKPAAGNKTGRDGATQAQISSRKGDRCAGISVFAVSLLFFIIGSVGAIGCWERYRFDTDVQRNGPRAAGHVTKKIYQKSDDGSDYRIKYDFALPSGARIHAARGISEELWSTIEEGQTLTIAYSREDPKQNFPLGEGETSLGFTFFISLFFALFAAFGGIFFCLLVFQALKARSHGHKEIED